MRKAHSLIFAVGLVAVAPAAASQPVVTFWASAFGASGFSLA